jgi:predicted DNA-binding protein YlxM (UPF0122 family)
MKTIKQIADELGVSKQRVYRCIKANHIIASHQKRDTLLFDEAVEMLIKSHFSPTLDHINEAPKPKKAVSNEADDVLHEADNAHHKTINDALVELLRAELEAKNSQIASLSAALEAAQKSDADTRELLRAVTLHGGTMQQTLIEEKAEPRNRGFFGRIFGKRAE